MNTSHGGVDFITQCRVVVCFEFCVLLYISMLFLDTKDAVFRRFLALKIFRFFTLWQLLRIFSPVPHTSCPLMNRYVLSGLKCIVIRVRILAGGSCTVFKRFGVTPEKLKSERCESFRILGRILVNCPIYPLFLIYHIGSLDSRD